MEFIGLIISLIITLIISKIIYNIFESSGYKGVVAFKMTLQIILLIISMILKSAPLNSETVLEMIKTIGATFVGALIFTAIELYAYNKSTSFFSFIMYNILISLFITLILIAVLFIILCLTKPILLANKMVKLLFIILLIILVIAIICLIIKFILNITTKKKIPYIIENNEETTNTEEELVNQEKPMLFCPNCGFKLDQNTKFCIGCGKYFNNKKI